MSLQAGARLGPYEIVSRLGAGGMGEVWRAHDSRLERDVAVKILPGEFSRDSRLKLRFEREARTISSLSHPHICVIHDVGEAILADQASPAGQQRAVPYLVMELLEGESLADRLLRGPLPLRDLLRAGAEIAEALDRAHRSGVVHRDLKPGNVMMTREGAKLLDFGLARSEGAGYRGGAATEEEATAVQPLTEEGTIVGTFHYMAPEQLESASVDHRADIFALGCVLYEMVTGRRAFDAPTRTALMAQIAGGEPRPLRELQRSISPVLEHLIHRCLEKSPDDRWQSAADIAGELRWIAEASGREPDAPRVLRRPALASGSPGPALPS